MDGLIYLFAAYTIVWVVLFLYVRGLTTRQRDLQKQLDDLKRS